MPHIVYGYSTYGEGGFDKERPRLDGYAFGDVSIQHGYARAEAGQSYGAFGAWGDFATDAPGRSDGDEYSQAPYFIPLDVDVSTDPAALQALAAGISYAQAKAGGDQLAAMIAVINDTDNQIAMFAAKLVQAMSTSGRADLQAAAQNWLQTSSTFQDIGQQIMSGTTPASRFPEWQALGQKLMSNGNSLANELSLPRLTFSAALAPAGFGKALGLLELLAYSAAAVAVLYFGSKIVGAFGSRHSYAGRH